MAVETIIADYAGRPQIDCSVCDRRIGFVLTNRVARHKWWPHGRASACPGSGRQIKGMAAWKAEQAAKKAAAEAAEAEQRQAEQEKRLRLHNACSMALMFPFTPFPDRYEFDYDGHRYEIREIE